MFSISYAWYNTLVFICSIMEEKCNASWSLMTPNKIFVCFPQDSRHGPEALI